MSATINLSAIVTAISGITVSDVTMKDIGAVVANWKAVPKVFFPIAERFIANARVDVESYGVNGSEKMDFSYTLNYRYLHVQAANPATLAVAYSGLVTNLVAIMQAIANNCAKVSGADIRFGGLQNMGPLQDPAGNVYLGADLAVNVHELLN